MPFQFSRLSRLLCVTVLVLGCSLPGQAAPARMSTHPILREPLVVLPTDIARSRILRRSVPVGRLDSLQTISAALSLPWRNGAALQNLVARQNDPHDPLYKKWLSAAEFNTRFAPSVKDYTTVTNWARNQGLTVTQTFPSRNLLIVRGSADVAKAAFHVEFGQYRMSDGRVAYANTAAPRLPRSVALVISGVSGLDNLSLRRPMLRRRPAQPAPYLLPRQETRTPYAAGGSGAGLSLTPADIKSAYNLTATDLPDGTGQTLALYELDGYLQSDINFFAATFSLGTPTLQNILINGFSGAPTTGADSAQLEVTLDIEMALALAPAARILVYEADNSSAGSLGIYNRIANDNLASVVSVSYGLAEESLSDSERASENTIFLKMVAQGQCVYVSSGDDGAYNPTTVDSTGALSGFVVSASDPAAQPNVVAVGGTTLTATLPDATTTIPTPTSIYGSETTWNTYTDTVPTATSTGGASGGGISKYWEKPTYQTGVGASLTLPATAGGVATPMRDVPDVALNADPTPGFTVYQANVDAPVPFEGITEGFTVVGGTSASSPLWAAFNILVNQKRAAFSLGRLGFANPDIYAIAESTNYSTTFHDIADASTNLVYAAGTGYDDTTGWGSFIGDALLAKLAPSTSDPQSLTVSVTNANGAAVAGASVIVSTPQISAFTNADAATGVYPVTDATGTYTVSLDSLLQSTAASTATALTYTVRVEKNGYAGKTFNSVAVPSALTVTLGAPDHVFTSPTTLQMISAPYDYTTAGDFLTLFNLTFASLVTGGPNLIAYSPDLSRYLVYPGVPADTLRLGQGYWARLPADGTVRRNGTPAPTNQAFRINLQAGWNQIGDPFLVSVPVSSLSVESTTTSGTPVSILLSSDITLPLYSYAVPTTTTGGFYQTLNAQTDSLQPWVGYWLFAKNAVTLVVPAPGG